MVKSRIPLAKEVVRAAGSPNYQPIDQIKPNKLDIDETRDGSENTGFIIEELPQVGSSFSTGESLSDGSPSDDAGVAEAARLLVDRLGPAAIMVVADLLTRRASSPQDAPNETGARVVAPSRAYGLVPAVTAGLARTDGVSTDIEVLGNLLGAKGISSEGINAALRAIRNIVAAETRPKWLERLERGGRNATLAAPAFLKEVHPDVIAEDGTVYKEDVVARDPDLMTAVDKYIAQRNARGQDLGEAIGLHLILKRPKGAYSPRSSRGNDI